ncbi:MAG: hypothetical protein Kow0062_25050 [Acidobacteriota bacterium]|nr:MAG: hypothetical protein D6738_11460 [Acidobacteriota bacterium]
MASQGESAWRLLGLSFLAGAIVDLAFGVTILFAAEQAAPLLRLTLPHPPVYLDLDGLFLCALGGLYLLIWRQPRRLAPAAAVATLLRFAGAALFAVGVATGRAEPVFAGFAVLDLAFAAVHLLLLRAAAGGLVAALAPWPEVDRRSGERL